MKKMLKRVSFAAGSTVLALPVVALAQITDPGSLTGPTGLSNMSLTQTVTLFMQGILAFVAVLAVIGFAISGIMYLTSAGDETRIETAKKVMIASITGLIVALIGLIVVAAVNNWLVSGSSEF